MPNKEEYIDSVLSEIKLKAARKYLRRELEEHIDDKAHELSGKGVPDAEDAAVAAMGNAKETGLALNAVHKPRTEWIVIACILLLSFASFVIFKLFTSDDINFIGGWSVENQLFIAFIGICVMVSAYFFNYNLIVKLRYIFFASALAYLGLYILVGWSWHIFASQSSAVTFSTLLFLLGIAGFIGRRKKQGVISLLIPVILCVVAMFALDMVGASLYSLLVSAVSAVMIGLMIHRSINKLPVKLVQILIIVLILSAALFLVTKINLYYLTNVWGFGTSIGDPGFSELSMSQIIISARFFGTSEYYLQYQSAGVSGSGTNYILTSVISRYGWAAAICISLVFTAMFVAMFIRIRRVEHPFGRILAVCAGVYLAARFILCILTNTGLITGLSCSLPFISYGYSGYLADSLLAGLFLSVWRRSSFMKKDSAPAEVSARAS